MVYGYAYRSYCGLGSVSGAERAHVWRKKRLYLTLFVIVSDYSSYLSYCAVYLGCGKEILRSLAVLVASIKEADITTLRYVCNAKKNFNRTQNVTVRHISRRWRKTFQCLLRLT